MSLEFGVRRYSEPSHGIQERPGFHPGLFAAVPIGNGSFSLSLPSTACWATFNRPGQPGLVLLLPPGMICPSYTAVLLTSNLPSG